MYYYSTAFIVSIAQDFGNFQPSGNGKCVVMGYGSGIWDDQPCSNRNKFICEIE
jgi:hypothetical protein